MLDIRRWFDADIVPPPGPPPALNIVGTKFDNQQVFATASVVQPVTQNVVGVKFDNAQTFFTAIVKPAQIIGGAKFTNQQVFKTAAVTFPPATPYRVKTGNITTSGSVGSASIYDDVANLPQQFLDINFPSPSGGGGANLGVNALSFAGADLGAKINNALAAGNFDIFVPNSAGLVISTPIRIKHSATIRFSARYPQYIDCKTNNKPVFEATDLNIRNFNIDGGFFQGNTVQTPSCFLLLASNSSLTQQGDCTPLSNLEVQGSWGLGVVIHIGAEVTVYDKCIFAMQSKGDSPWAGTQHTVRIADADYWGVPFAYTQPNTVGRSTSANVFSNCTIGYDPQDSGSGVLLKGQAEDTTIDFVYMNSVGRCHVLTEAGFRSGSWFFPRRILLTGGGRTENNKGPAWAGCPLVIADGFDQGFGNHLLTLGPMGVFFGGAGGSVPVLQSIRGGRFGDLTIQQGIFVTGTDTLIESLTADLTGADITCPHDIKINCTGRTISDSFIRNKGQVLGTVAASSRVRASNFNNW